MPGFQKTSGIEFRGVRIMDPEILCGLEVKWVLIIIFKFSRKTHFLRNTVYL